MKKARKALLTLCAALLLVSMTVGATVAYLTSTDSVTNTFTVGDVKITMDEATTVLEDGNWNGDVVLKNGTTTVTGEQAAAADFDSLTVLPEEKAVRGKANTYKLMPGRSYVKDPTVHVDPASENAWLFVKVTNDISAIMDATTIENQMLALGWEAVDATNGIYAYKNIVKANDDIVVFEYFKIKDDADVSTYGSKTIVVEAYAVQADGFANYAAAWTEAPYWQN